MTDREQSNELTPSPEELQDSRNWRQRLRESYAVFLSALPSRTVLALRWILMSPAVTCAIPGAKRPAQVEENVRAADLPPLSDALMAEVRTIYNGLVRPQVHHYW